MSNELQTLNQNSIVAAFSTKGGVNELFERIAEEVRKEVPDVNTDKGRKAIGTLAAKVSKSKKIIEEAGKSLVAEQKAQIKLIDDDRIAVVKMFESLYREVLAPRDAWQKAEDERVLSHENAIKDIENLYHSANADCYSSSEIKVNIEKLKLIDVNESFEEFQDKAKLAKYENLELLNMLLIRVKQKEAQQAELEKQRIAEQERLQREHEERIAQQAAEQARINAEQKARAEIEKAEREKQEVIEREAKLKLEAEQAIIREQQAKERAEQQLKQAEHNKQLAIIAERERIEKQQKAEAEHQAKLEAQRKENIEHMRQINNDILTALTQAGISEEQAKNIIKMIAKSEVPHVSIAY